MTYGIALALGIWVLAVVLNLLGTLLAIFHYGFPPTETEKKDSELPPISIFKPLKGIDGGLRENLDTFFRFDYPKYELIFSVADRGDPACGVVQDLMRRYPEVQARLIRGAVDIGPNPKINNLIHSYDNARYDWILNSDSNVRVGTDYLRRMAAYIEPGVGIISAVIGGQYARGPGGALEKTILNTFYARWAMLTALVGTTVVVGKSMLFQKSTAERFGGLKALADYLAEDCVSGFWIEKMGLKVVIMREPVHQYVANQSFQAFWKRHVRWGRIRRNLAPLPAFLTEPWVSSFPSGFLGAWAFNHLFGIAPSLFLALHFGFWSICDMILMYRMEGRLDMNAPFHWFVRELLHAPMWIAIVSGNTVEWRGKKLIIGKGSRLYLMPEDEHVRALSPERPEDYEIVESHEL